MDTEFEHMIPLTALTSGAGMSVARDLYAYTVQIVNIGFIGEPDRPDDWLLVDAGMPKSASTIIAAAERRFGPAARPRAILLTHGHFDHVGALPELVKHWNVPVFAHREELPYLTGAQDYPTGNAAAGGGLVTLLSPFFPNHGLRLKADIQPLPEDGRVPFTDDWQWLHTPGHTPGHVSFHRPFDGALIAGDAFITVKQESMYHVLVQDVSFNGPPAYFTTDWQAASASISRLALKPRYALTGHGRPVYGEELRQGLEELTTRFSKWPGQPYNGRVQ